MPDFDEQVAGVQDEMEAALKNVLFCCWLLQVTAIVGTSACHCQRVRRGEFEAREPAAQVDTGCPTCSCNCCGTRIFLLGMVMQCHQVLSITFALVPFAGLFGVPVVVLGNLCYWPGYLRRDRCKIGVYTCFQFVGLFYWLFVLFWPTAVLGAIIYAAGRLISILAWLAFVPIGFGVWVNTGGAIQVLLHIVLWALLALVFYWVVIPLNLLTCLIGAVLGSIATCNKPYAEGEAPPLVLPPVVVLATVAIDDSTGGKPHTVLNPMSPSNLE